MATYAELRTLYTNDTLRTKVQVAATIAAHTVLTGADTESPYDQTAGKHDLRVTWAQGVLSAGHAYAENLLKLVLAANAGATVAAITSATDAAVLANIEAIVDALAQG